MRTAVFDLDGTLADTAADLIAAANVALAEGGYGAPLAFATDRAAAFAGGRAMLRLGLARRGALVDGPVVERLYPRLLAAYAQALCEETRLYDGAEAALAALAAAGWRLGICTNKPLDLAEALLARLGVRDRFAAVLGAESLPQRKPDPAPVLATIARSGGVPARAVMVGDTAADREAARAAGIPCVLVDFGPEGAAAALRPEAVIVHFNQLPSLAERLVPAAH